MLIFFTHKPVQQSLVEGFVHNCNDFCIVLEKMNIDVTALRIYNVIKHCAVQNRLLLFTSLTPFEQYLLEYLGDFLTSKWYFYRDNISL